MVDSIAVFLPHMPGAFTFDVGADGFIRGEATAVRGESYGDWI